jgi:peptidoglycan/xylan/chitin deacetylase (PgdA/CDA1 family)
MRKDGLWPDGVKAAVVLTYDFDAETLWLCRNPESANSPRVLSEGAYEPKVAVPRLLEMMDRVGVKSTFFVPGWVIERYPDVVRSVADAGHEIAYHGYLHEKPCSPEHEEELIVKCKSIMKDVLGVTPVGHRSPMGDVRPGTIDVLCRNGFEYSANMMDFERPYLHVGENGNKLVELPSNWLYEDASHFFFTIQEPQRRPIAAPSTVTEIWRTEFDGLYDEGNLLVLIFHPQMIGRISRVRMLEQLITYMKSRPGTWIAPAVDVARAVRKRLETTHP